jgi:hypothetical protein
MTGTVNHAANECQAIEWEIDFLKYDACIYSAGVASRARYEAMSRALNATGVTFMSMCFVGPGLQQ